MGAFDLGGIAMGALVLALGVLVAAVSILLASAHREREHTRAQLAHILAALGAVGGAVEQARAEALAASLTGQAIRGLVAEVHHETCGPVTLRPLSLRPTNEDAAQASLALGGSQFDGPSGA